MNEDKILEVIKTADLKIEPGVSYIVYECCIKETGTTQHKMKQVGKKRCPVCKEHDGAFLGRYKLCASCGCDAIGAKVRTSSRCNNCKNSNADYGIAYIKRKNNENIKIKRPYRGEYCRKFKAEQNGCFLCDNCDYCIHFDPFFPNTGPPLLERK